jgi:hypothetical protein
VSGSKEVVSLLQYEIFNNPTSTGALIDREQQLVSDLLRLYRNGSSFPRIEETLSELRTVRKQLHLRETPRRRQ